MDKQLVIFYAKRHLFGIVGLLLAIGFIVGGILVSKGTFASLDAANKAWEDEGTKYRIVRSRWT